MNEAEKELMAAADELEVAALKLEEAERRHSAALRMIEEWRHINEPVNVRLPREPRWLVK